MTPVPDPTHGEAQTPPTSDALIVGAGAAGLSLALHLAKRHRVTVLCKREVEDGSTLWAQGGISAVLDASDSIESHVQDTLRAGAGLCHEATVRHAVEHAPQAIRWLSEQGVAFTRENPKDPVFHLTREGGHSHRRVVHVDDATGQAVELTLVERARQHPNIVLRPWHLALDLITHGMGDDKRCVGVYALDLHTRKVMSFRAPAVVLATGGCGKVYLYTSNPDVATGDGIAMAWRAGCRVGNLEFIQFHPTCLYHPDAKSFLITEAVRGEGGQLSTPTTSPGQANAKLDARFMPRFDPRAELASRDIVARAIDHEMKRLGLDYVHLDISHRAPDFVTGHFPNVHKRCLDYGYDMTTGPIPVVPAAHYSCGGVVTDLRGRTDLKSLYAIGETAFTGLHGANRMASNSLLECLVFAKAAATDIEAELEAGLASPTVPTWDESRVTSSKEEVVVSHNWDELRRVMWDYVGIVRTTRRLQRAQGRIAVLRAEAEEHYRNHRITRDLIELRNLALVAELIVGCALARHESRGLHFSVDYPSLAPQAKDTILAPKVDGEA